MPSGGGGGTKEVVTQAPPQNNPPQLLPEAKEGFTKAQDFYKSILAQPPIFGGARVPGIPQSIQTGLTNLQDIGTGGPLPEEVAARNLTFTTASGGSLAANPFARTFNVIDPSLTQTSSGADLANDPFAATHPEIMNPAIMDFAGGKFLDPSINPFFAGAQRNILNPIFEKFSQVVQPGIRDKFVSAGGEGSARNVLSEEQAIRDLGRASTDALAPFEASIFENERALQQQAAIEESRLSEAELGRATGEFAGQSALKERAGEITSGLSAGELSRAGSIYNLERQLQEASAGRAGEGVALDLLRTNALLGAGQTERGFEGEKIGAEQALFEEPIFRQSAAAQSLLQAPTSAGIPGGMTRTASETPGALGIGQGLGSLALTLALTGLIAGGLFGGGGAGAGLLV